MHKILVSIFFLIICFQKVNAARLPISINGQINGQVIDAITKKPIEFATVSLFLSGSSVPQTGVSSDALGKFTFKNLDAGSYMVKVDFIGYQSIKRNISLSATTASVNISQLMLQPIQNKLQEITVTASAATVVNKIDKLVYSPANDLTSQGGVALDVLKKVPQITVDIDGNVELQGNPNIRFLINGKPSSIFGASLADALQSIPASQIKNIEVMTVPGAKYDAQGTGGVINIILKNNKVEGINGSINLSAGTRLENGSFNLNAKKGKFGVNLFFSGNEQLNSRSNVNNHRLSFNKTRDTITNLTQDSRNQFTRGGFEGGLNLTYSLSPKDELTASTSLNRFGNHRMGITSQFQTTLAYMAQINSLTSLRNSVNKFDEKSTDWSLNYKKTFKKEDQALEFLYSSTSGQTINHTQQQQDYMNSTTPSTGTRSSNPGNDHETAVSVDYTQPISKSFTIETGAKAIIEKLSNTVLTDTLLGNKTYASNAGQSYGFNYNRKIFAYYFSASFSLFNKFLDIKSGLRYEYTLTSVDFAGTSIPPSHIYSPTLVFSHKLNEQELIKISYTYRIERPDYGDLNPFYNVSDPHNINVGNVNLRPEIGHNFELGFNKSFEKGSSIYIAGIYRQNTDDIQAINTFYSLKTINGITYSNVSINQRYNIGSEISAGVNIYGSVKLGPKLNLRSNMFFVDRITSNPGSPTVSGPAYRINLNGSYEFKHNLAAEFFVNYRSTQRTIQGHNAAFAFYNLAVRKQFMNKKASIGLTAANPFNKYIVQHSSTYGTNFNQTELRQLPFRSFGISFSYKFGKLEFKGGKEKDDNASPAPSEN